MSSFFVRFTLVAMVAVAAGCNKVSQDQFDQSMAQMQTQLDEQSSGIEANAEGIDALQVELDALQVELEELADEYHAMVERYQDHIMFASPVNFDFDSSDVRAGDDEFLERFAHVVAHHYANSVVTVQGYTDAAGPEEYNKVLSQKRAEAVREFLLGEGVEADRLEAAGFGESKPIAPNKSRAGREMNRRVEFIVVGEP